MSDGAMTEKKRILTGIRPTGPLHLGHYAGALENWVKLQREYDCYFLIADYQVSDYADDLPRVRNAVWEVALDWLAVGLDPERGQLRHRKPGAGARRVDDVAGVVPARRHARTQPDAQGGDGGDREPRRCDDEREVGSRGVLHLSGDAGREHPHAPCASRAGGRGPAAAHRADAGDGATLQPRVQADLPRAARRCSAACRVSWAPMAMPR